ncbi:hypothetical protein HAX54_035555, partial [Datura stramonium]|nr:hypothetical protein [Datura stramonium]
LVPKSTEKVDTRLNDSSFPVVATEAITLSSKVHLTVVHDFLCHPTSHSVPHPEEAESPLRNRANDSGHEPLGRLMSHFLSR